MAPSQRANVIAAHVTSAVADPSYIERLKAGLGYGGDGEAGDPPSLRQAWTPVSEESDLVPVEVVEGSVPLDLMGRFCRIGPNPQFSYNNKAYHPFDGDGTIHQVEFDGGKIRYQLQLESLGKS